MFFVHRIAEVVSRESAPEHDQVEEAKGGSAAGRFARVLPFDKVANGK